MLTRIRPRNPPLVRPLTSSLEPLLLRHNPPAQEHTFAALGRRELFRGGRGFSERSSMEFHGASG
jgi:hypothetical protein